MQATSKKDQSAFVSFGHLVTLSDDYAKSTRLTDMADDHQSPREMMKESPWYRGQLPVLDCLGIQSSAMGRLGCW